MKARAQHQLELFHGRHVEQRWPRLKAGAVCSRCDRRAVALVRVGKGFAARCDWHSSESLPPSVKNAARRR